MLGSATLVKSDQFHIAQRRVPVATYWILCLIREALFLTSQARIRSNMDWICNPAHFPPNPDPVQHGPDLQSCSFSCKNLRFSSSRSPSVPHLQSWNTRINCKFSGQLSPHISFPTPQSFSLRAGLLESIRHPSHCHIQPHSQRHYIEPHEI